jgi:hypothetical protein
MPHTLNQYLLSVLTIAAVIAIVYLVILLVQLRRTAAEAQRALAEFREAARGLQALELTVKDRLDDVGQIVDVSKKTIQAVSHAARFLTPPTAGSVTKFWPVLLPVAQFIWRRWKSRKEGKNVGE